jgi:hypothetical protein
MKIICVDCGCEREENEECEICTAMLRIQKLARERRKDYAIKKHREERLEDEEPNLPYADK